MPVTDMTHVGQEVTRLLNNHIHLLTPAKYHRYVYYVVQSLQTMTVIDDNGICTALTPWPAGTQLAVEL